MSRIPVLGVAAVLAVALSGAAPGAEAVKLRPMEPVYVGGTGVGVREPEGIACGRGGIVVVADTGNGRLVPFEVQPDRLAPRPEIVAPQFPAPIRVGLDSRGAMFVLDGRSRRIAELTPAGEFVGYVEPKGDAAGAMTPRSFVVGPDDRLWVLDVGTSRVRVLDRSGAVARDIAFPAEHGFLSDLAVDGKGRVYAVDSTAHRVYGAGPGDPALAPVGEDLRRDLDFPVAIAADAHGQLFLADQNGGGIVVLGTDGAFRGRRSGWGWKPGFLRYPSGLCFDATGNLYVADRGNNRIQVFQITE